MYFVNKIFSMEYEHFEEECRNVQNGTGFLHIKHVAV